MPAGFGLEADDDTAIVVVGEGNGRRPEDDSMQLRTILSRGDPSTGFDFCFRELRSAVVLGG